MDQIQFWKEEFEKSEFFKRHNKDYSYLWKEPPKPQVKKYDKPFNYKLTVNTFDINSVTKERISQIKPIRQV